MCVTCISGSGSSVRNLERIFPAHFEVTLEPRMTLEIIKGSIEICLGSWERVSRDMKDMPVHNNSKHRFFNEGEVESLCVASNKL